MIIGDNGLPETNAFDVELKEELLPFSNFKKKLLKVISYLTMKVIIMHFGLC